MFDLSPLAAGLSCWLGRAQRLSPQHWDIVRRIKESARTWQSLDDGQLASQTQRLRSMVHAGHAPLSADVLIPMYSLVHEAIRRTMGIELYDQQLLAGIVLAEGTIAEMQTGEGKTITAVAPAMLHALSGKGVHVVTVNQYLAERDFVQLRPVYERLGTSVGLLQGQGSAQAKRHAYRCDVTYGPGYEFGFDFLRDQLSGWDGPPARLGQTYRSALRGRGTLSVNLLQRGHAFAIIDEIDSVLIDEARIPLVLSCADHRQEGPPGDRLAHDEAHRLASELHPDRDFTIDQKTRQVQLSASGYAAVQETWPLVEGTPLARPWSIYVQQALKALIVLRKNVDYVVRDNKVYLVDESTGRIFPDRSWQDGLHQAVEVKEGLAVRGEKPSLARISRQRYFRRYDLVCGMTGTAQGAQREFWETYRLGVVPIPLRAVCRRRVLAERCFVDQAAKWAALIDEVVRIHATGQPILVGTRSIEDSQQLANRFRHIGVPYRLLNGVQDQSEAEVVARAGQVGAVTIATNMAGRGTDIKLSSEAVRRGGLHVIGEQRNDERRVDRQLAGRAARQGDPGSCQFFSSADDRLIRQSGGALRNQMKRHADAQGEVHADFTGRIDKLQRKCERQGYGHRKELLYHDRWLEELMRQLTDEDAA
jgi:preprotein translocase subunit SecA